MNIVFFGTSEFAVPSLEVLAKSRHKLICVVTQPQRKKGRGLKVLPQPIEESAKELALNVERFKDINSQQAQEFLSAQKADLFVVIAFGQILSKRVLEIPGLYSINMHASLLPKYRGASPIQWAIINGEKTTGVTMIRINEFLDKGDIIAQKTVYISDDDDAVSLSEKLGFIGADLLIATLDKIESGDVTFKQQDETVSSFAPKLKKEDGLVDWEKDAISIKNLIRGCQPWPSAYTYLNKKLFKILEADAVSSIKAVSFGKVIETNENGILLGCKDGGILLKRVQIEGKRPLTTAEFLRGNPIPKDTILG